jgi:UDP-N-acetylmuramoyl-L-alanyl-D-glutamate--2,6-diaminopimelate ligase
MQADAQVTARVLKESLTGTRFVLSMQGMEREITTPLIGRHNVSNALAAAAAVSQLGASLTDIQHGLETLTAVPGRLERVGGPRDSVQVFVDYAHTDDALRRCVESVRRVTPGRLICVFGAGGDRDRAKRPLMGRAASGADLVVVTSDNPRSEKPEQIVQDILAGFDGQSKPHTEVDRTRAIQWAIRQARPGDCVIIAGKGHETTQIIGRQAIPFDDRQVAAAALQARTDIAAPLPPDTQSRKRA